MSHRQINILEMFPLQEKLSYFYLFIITVTVVFVCLLHNEVYSKLCKSFCAV